VGLMSRILWVVGQSEGIARRVLTALQSSRLAKLRQEAR
jgi:hypothetical protein